MFGSSGLNDALESIDMEWLLQREGISYKESYGRSGRQLNARECPFCHHKEYRVYINAETGVGNCFSGSCPQKTFNKWSFIKGLYQSEGRNLSQIISNLAREQGWRPKNLMNTVGIRDYNTLSLPDGAVTTWGFGNFPEYLTRRGVDEELAEMFGLHWCDKGVYRYMDPRGFEASQDYSNRIILPIFDMLGEMVSFQGRDITGTAERRYLFPPGFASAGAYLYNANSVSATHHTVVISEGVFDVIQTARALRSEGLLETFLPVGSFGMHFSCSDPTGADQLGQLRTMKNDYNVKNVIFLWDGERKAQAAAIQACLDIRQIGLKTSVALLPDGKDPGSTYPEAIRDAIKAAIPCESKIDAIKLAREVGRRFKTE